VKERFKMFRRKGGIYYARDTVTLGKQSLGTSDRVQATRLVGAKNQAVEQPSLNKGMAKVYLSAASPEFAARTWNDVMEKYVTSGADSSKARKDRAFRSRPYVALHKLKLIDTSAEHLFAVLEHQKAGNSTHHYLRRLHNFALHLGWLLAPVMAEAAWPAVHSKKFIAVTEEEHQRIITKEGNVERRLFYQMLWETGGSQTDIAHLSWNRIDRETQVIQFQRQKLANRRSGGASCLRIGPRLQGVLDQLPQQGDLFPKIKLEDPKHRAAEFRRRCRTLKIEGRTLHSYRYSWAQRARMAGMPERDAMNHLGHKFRAIHIEYAAAATVTVLPLEFYEEERQKKILRFDQQTDAARPLVPAVVAMAK
jgi:integrase